MRKTQADLNREIAALVTAKGINNESYSNQEKELISKYSGSGGLGVEANPDAVLYEYYTPDYVANLMFELAKTYGYKGGYVLEPSCATGALIKPIPNKARVVGFEVSEITSKITKILYPKANIINAYFETAFLQSPRYRSVIKDKQPTWLDEYPFELVIGNPPYGIYKNFYTSYFKGFKQIEQFFIYKGLQMLNKDGLLVYIISSNFLSNGSSYNSFKEKIEPMAKLLDAYRLPPVMKNTSVPVDIIVLKRL